MTYRVGDEVTFETIDDELVTLTVEWVGKIWVRFKHTNKKYEARQGTTHLVENRGRIVGNLL